MHGGRKNRGKKPLNKKDLKTEKEIRTPDIYCEWCFTAVTSSSLTESYLILAVPQGGKECYYPSSMGEGPETQRSEAPCTRLLLSNSIWLDAGPFPKGPGSPLTVSSYLGHHSPRRRRLCVFLLAVVPKPGQASREWGSRQCLSLHGDQPPKEKKKSKLIQEQEEEVRIALFCD